MKSVNRGWGLGCKNYVVGKVVFLLCLAILTTVLGIFSVQIHYSWAAIIFLQFRH